MQVAIEEYKGKKGRRSLARALRGMVLLRDSKELATEVAEEAKVTLCEGGTILIEEGADDRDIYFVLSGRLQVSINGREFALLGPGAHVGEFAVIDQRATRSATVRAMEDTVCAKLSEPAFMKIAENNQFIWRNMSQVLGNHLRQGNRFVRRPNDRPRVMICTSEIGWPFAQAIKTHAADSKNKIPAWLVEIRCVEDSDSIESIEKAFEEVDLGVLLVAPGDTESREGIDSVAGRDALFLQCGICLGAVGRHRTIIVEPKDLGDSSPAAQLNLIPLTYRLDPHEALKSDIDAICRDVQGTIQDLGAR